MKRVVVIDKHTNTIIGEGIAIESEAKETNIVFANSLVLPMDHLITIREARPDDVIGEEAITQ